MLLFLERLLCAVYFICSFTGNYSAALQNIFPSNLQKKTLRSRELQGLAQGGTTNPWVLSAKYRVPESQPSQPASIWRRQKCTFRAVDQLGVRWGRGVCPNKQHSSAAKLRTETYKTFLHPPLIEILAAAPRGRCHDPHYAKKGKLRLRDLPRRCL